MTAAERLAYAGYEEILIFENYSYDDALIGVTEGNRAVYDFDKMVAWLCKKEGFSKSEAIEWVNYNAVRAASYAGADAPIIMHRLDE